MSQADILLESLSVADHLHQVIDSDVPFSVDPIARKITNESSPLKNILVQGDHDSEKFTFKIPRYIEGHDMALCDVARVHFINISTEIDDEGETKFEDGVYTMHDLKIVDDKFVACSWDIKHSSLTYEGSLHFALVFMCLDGKRVSYRWGTRFFEDIFVAKGPDSDLHFESRYCDVIEQWKEAVRLEFTEYINAEVAEQVDIVQIGKNKENIVNLTEEMAVQKARMDNFTKLPEGSTTGDAELKDVCVGRDAVVYPTAGDAVRNQIYNIETMTRDVLSSLNIGEIIDYTLIPGFISGTGESMSQSEEYKEFVTELIPVKALDFITVYMPILEGTDPWRAVSYYDVDGNFISRSAFNEERYSIVPTVDGYINISFRSFGSTYMLISRKDLSNISTTIIAEHHKSNLDYIPLEFNRGFIRWDGDVLNPTRVSREIHTTYIPVIPGQKYVFISKAYNPFDNTPDLESHWCGVNAYDIDKNHIGRITSESITEKRTDHIYTLKVEFTIPVNAAFIIISTRVCDEIIANLALVNDPSTKYINNYSVVKGIAHRGYSIGAPENTLSAYVLAKKHGFSYVECDVSFSSDGVGVLLHDDTIDRTSNDSGKVNEITLDELKALDFGSWFSLEYAGETIPTFAEFISLCRKIGLHPYIELKGGTKEQIISLVDIVRKYGMERKVTWISFSKGYLEHIRDCDRKARLGYVRNSVTDEIILNAKSLLTGENEVFIDSGSVTDEEVQLCMDAGLPLEVWTINNKNTILSMHPYVSGVTSDNLLADRVLYESVID